ncbi:MAG TPA: DUF2334 domain-containing protein [Pseudonocardiaceae bacterium]|nr:DUF2334 domain-containing protein [Pseudonocardiaceae bacterium]
MTTRTLDATVKFAADLDDRAVPMSLLVSPKRQAGEPAVLDWLRLRTADTGDALVLHGMDHGPKLSRRSWPVSPTLPRPGKPGISEFALLPAHEAGLKLLAARVMLHSLGLPTDGFAPPNWLASLGTLTALRRNGFSFCAELRGVRELATGDYHGGRVLGFGPGHRGEHWWCLAVVLGAARIARRGGLVRLAVHADDLRRPAIGTALRDAVDIALHHGARPATYTELVGPAVAVPAPRPAERVPAAHRADHARQHEQQDEFSRSH